MMNEPLDRIRVASSSTGDTIEQSEDRHSIRRRAMETCNDDHQETGNNKMRVHVKQRNNKGDACNCVPRYARQRRTITAKTAWCLLVTMLSLPWTAHASIRESVPNTTRYAYDLQKQLPDVPMEVRQFEASQEELATCFETLAARDSNNDNRINRPEFLLVANDLSNEYFSSQTSFRTMPPVLRAVFITLYLNGIADGRTLSLNIFGTKEGQTPSPEQQQFLTSLCNQVIGAIKMVAAITPPPAPPPTPAPTLSPVDERTDFPTLSPTPLPSTPEPTLMPTTPLPTLPPNLRNSAPPTIATISPAPTKTPAPTITALPTTTTEGAPNTTSLVPTTSSAPTMVPTVTQAPSTSSAPTTTASPTITPRPTNVPSISPAPTITPNPTSEIVGTGFTSPPTITASPTITPIPTATPAPTVTPRPSNPPTPPVSETLEPTTTPIPTFTPFPTNVFGPITTENCNEALESADIDENNALNREEFVLLVNIISNSDFDNFSDLPVVLRALFVDLANENDNVFRQLSQEINIFGARPDQEVPDDQEDFLLEVCRQTQQAATRGEPPSEGPPSVSPPSLAPTITMSPTSLVETRSGGDDGLSSGAIAGIVLAFVFGYLIALLLCLYFRERRRKENQDEEPGDIESGQSSGSSHSSDDETEPLLAAAGARAAGPPGNNVGVPRLQDVYSTPIELDEGSYEPPQFSKSQDEEAFLDEAMSENVLFTNLSDAEKMTLITAFQKFVTSEDSEIIQQGEPHDFVYIVQSGSVRLEANESEVGEASPGDTLGELSFLHALPSPVSYIADGMCVFWRIDQKTFRSIVQSVDVREDEQKMDLLRGIPFLDALDDEDLEKLAKVLIPRPFSEGDDVVEEGDEQTLFVISEGTVYSEETGASLGPGQYFGEEALMSDDSYVTEVAAASDGMCYMVDRDTFDITLGPLVKLILKAEEKRSLDKVKFFGDHDLDRADLEALADLITYKRFATGSIVIEEGEDVEPRLYLVRGGVVKTVSSIGAHNATVPKGGHFGDEEFYVEGLAMRPSNYTVRVVEDATLGFLNISDALAIVDAKEDELRISKHDSYEVEYEDLEPQQILGEGTFGQVWLCSTAPDQPYALKVQSKYDLSHRGQASAALREKNILMDMKSPFIVELITTYQDRALVAFLLEFIQGGELYSVLHRGTWHGVPEESAKFYAAGILEALNYMHRRRVVHRNIKPENVLIDTSGYPVLVDFGFAKVVKNKTYTLCGSPLYIAPEVLLNRGHDLAADYWSYGVLVFEMIAGYTPFYDEEGLDHTILFRRIIEGNYLFPETSAMSPEAEDMVSHFLVTDPTQRLGSLAGGTMDIYNSLWFDGTDFDSLRRREIESPWTPDINERYMIDTSNFEELENVEDKLTMEYPALTRTQEEAFSDFAPFAVSPGYSSSEGDSSSSEEDSSSSSDDDDDYDESLGDDETPHNQSVAATRASDSAADIMSYDDQTPLSYDEETPMSYDEQTPMSYGDQTPMSYGDGTPEAASTSSASSIMESIEEESDDSHTELFYDDKDSSSSASDSSAGSEDQESFGDTSSGDSNVGIQSRTRREFDPSRGRGGTTSSSSHPTTESYSTPSNLTFPSDITSPSNLTSQSRSTTNPSSSTFNPSSLSSS